MAALILPDPIENPRWAQLLERHPSASVFHSPGWLNALRQTYGYEPFVVTTSTGPTLENGLIACRVKGWTSSRLVSLPFSDHCDPLMDDAADLSNSLECLLAHGRAIGSPSVELRPTPSGAAALAGPGTGALTPGNAYCFHQLDLGPSETEIFRRFHPSSMQRAIRRAEREALTYEEGTSDRMLASFYRLLRMSRRRHGLPPQPLAWFRNLLTSLGNRVSIHVASKAGRPIAGILTLSFKKTMYYKYGGSDAAHHRSGGMPFLFWRVIQDARAQGFAQFDLGRSDFDQPGLIAFKDHFGSVRSKLTYYRYPEGQRDPVRDGWMLRMAKHVFARMPDAALDLAGKSIYKHLG
jgi:CelD/BcsL family acetyltransferase involved in cellulose biosynthesis